MNTTSKILLTLALIGATRSPECVAELGFYALIRTNTVTVADVWQYDDTAPPKIKTNFISVPCPNYVEAGWSHQNGVWIDPGGNAATDKQNEADSRDKLIRRAKRELKQALGAWDSLTSAQQRAVTKLCAEILVLLLKEDRI